MTPVAVETISPSLVQGTENHGLISREDFNTAFHLHGLTSVEVMEVFTMADVNKDGMLSQDEWKGFHTFFVAPFQQITQKWKMTKDDLKQMVTQIWFKSLYVEGAEERTFEGFGPHEHGENKVDIPEDIMLAIDRDLDGTVNFAEYLMMRRAAHAWVECAQETMNRAGLRCGLSIVVPSRQVDQSEADVVFRVGLTLMPKNKWSISFPIFVMVSDLYRTFSAFDVPIDNGFINQNELLRQLAEQDLPHRITPGAAKEIFKATGQQEIQFPLFCFSVIIFNRYTQQLKALDVPALNLDGFLAILHDKMVPNYIRKTIDAIKINIPDSMISAAASELSKFGATAGMMAMGNIAEVSDEKEPVLPLTEKAFMVNFLQKRSGFAMKTRTYMSQKNEEALSKMKETLKAAGLACPVDNEFKQRAMVQLILNDAANEQLTFSEFYALFRQADLFNLFTDEGDGYKSEIITAGNIMVLSERVKDKVNALDLAKISTLANSMGVRQMNFKHFLGFLRTENIFRKFKVPYEENDVTLDELTAGMEQLGYPVIRGVCKKHKTGKDFSGNQLQKYNDVVVGTIFAEMEAIMTLDSDGQPNKLLRKINERALGDARAPPAPSS